MQRSDLTRSSFMCRLLFCVQQGVRGWVMSRPGLRLQDRAGGRPTHPKLISGFAVVEQFVSAPRMKMRQSFAVSPDALRFEYPHSTRFRLDYVAAP